MGGSSFTPLAGMERTTTAPPRSPRCLGTASATSARVTGSGSFPRCEAGARLLSRACVCHSRPTPAGRANFRRLLVVPESYQVVVLHDVLFGLQAPFARALGLRLAAGLDEIVKADDFGADEPLLNVGVNRSGRFPRRRAGADGPGAVFFPSDGEETNVAALLECAHQESVRSAQFRRFRHDDRSVGIEIVRGNRFQFLGREAGGRDGFLADQPVGELLEDGFFGIARVAAEPRLD